MLEYLLGSKNLQKILIFLFVNGKCYGTQLSRSLQTPLTPLQKALIRLEKGGIILSDYEGKTRIYQFNPAYPLLAELEQLLKKAYTLLPPHEKKIYCFIHKKRTFQEAEREIHTQILLNFWKRLSKANTISLHVKTKSIEENGWNGKGTGEVIVEREGESILIFQERGSWIGKEGQDIDFKNIFRWTLDQKIGLISLEHLRFGPQHPVFLFHLSPSGNNTLSSIDSHLCNSDTYYGQMFCDPHYLRLNWRVIGPKKNEEIDYYYTTY